MFASATCLLLVSAGPACRLRTSLVRVRMLRTPTTSLCSFGSQAVLNKTSTTSEVLRCRDVSFCLAAVAAFWSGNPKNIRSRGPTLVLMLNDEWRCDQQNAGTKAGATAIEADQRPRSSPTIHDGATKFGPKSHKFTCGREWRIYL